MMALPPVLLDMDWHHDCRHDPADSTSTSSPPRPASQCGAPPPQPDAPQRRAYVGRVDFNRTQAIPATSRSGRRSNQQRPRPKDEWTPVAGPAIVSDAMFDAAQRVSRDNSKWCPRNTDDDAWLRRGDRVRPLRCGRQRPQDARPQRHPPPRLRVPQPRSARRRRREPAGAQGATSAPTPSTSCVRPRERRPAATRAARRRSGRRRRPARLLAQRTPTGSPASHTGPPPASTSSTFTNADNSCGSSWTRSDLPGGRSGSN